MFLLSSVKLVQLLSSNLDLMNYLLVLHLYPTFLSAFLIISKLLLNTAASSSTTSDLPKCLPFPTFLALCIFKMHYWNILWILSLSSIMIVMKQVICRGVVTCLFSTSDNIAPEIKLNVMFWNGFFYLTEVFSQICLKKEEKENNLWN